MKKTILAAVLALTAGATAIVRQRLRRAAARRSYMKIREGVQTGRFRRRPVGHRQPARRRRAFRENLGNPNDPVNRKTRPLDRKIKSICRGC